MADTDHPRLILPNFLSLEQCTELEFIHKSCGTVGYRPNVFSTTLSHLIATNSAHLIMPFVPIREALKEKVEEYFECEFELVIEFTGLISWTAGASIGWHSDDNKPYLRQRDFAAVCYLNSHGKDFEGGLFHFQDGEPGTFVPSAGDVLIYTADDRNIHSVDEIIDGERLTLTLWFTRDISHDEDVKLVSMLSQCPLNNSDNLLQSCLPLPASSNMYWYSTDQASHDQSGFDIRWARMQIIGYDVLCSGDNNSALDLSELQQETVQLARGDELYDLEFANVLHALQVAQFCCWKASYLQHVKPEGYNDKVVKLLQPQQDRIGGLKSMFVKDLQIPEKLFGFKTLEESKDHHSDWSCFSAAVTAWEEYSCRLCKELYVSVPNWNTHQSIFSVPIDEP